MTMLTREYLWKDGIHLKNEVTRIIAGNLVDLIKKYQTAGRPKIKINLSYLS